MTDETSNAGEQLRELGIYYGEVAAAQEKYATKAEQARDAKKALEAATSALLEKVRACTQGAALPLFDADQREADQAAMEAAALEDAAALER